MLESALDRINVPDTSVWRLRVPFYWIAPENSEWCSFLLTVINLFYNFPQRLSGIFTLKKGQRMESRDRAWTWYKWTNSYGLSVVISHSFELESCYAIIRGEYSRISRKENVFLSMVWRQNRFSKRCEIATRLLSLYSVTYLFPQTKPF